MGNKAYRIGNNVCRARFGPEKYWLIPPANRPFLGLVPGRDGVIRDKGNKRKPTPGLPAGEPAGGQKSNWGEGVPQEMPLGLKFKEKANKGHIA